MWFTHKFEYEGHKVYFDALIFEPESDYGIRGLRFVSKLWIQVDGVTVYNYDRGLDPAKYPPYDRAILRAVKAKCRAIHDEMLAE